MKRAKIILAISFVLLLIACNPQMFSTYSLTCLNDDGSVFYTEEVYDGICMGPSQIPSKDGHTFLGWSLKKGDSTLFDFSTKVTSDITLYPVWEIENYTVYFGGINVSDIPGQVVEYGSKATIPEPPTRYGYTFKGWRLDGEADLYDFDTPVKSNIVLYTVWEENALPIYTVTFDTDGGSSISPIEVQKGNSIAKPSNPIKDGYAFKGWKSNKEGPYYYYFGSQVTNDMTLYADWVLIQDITVSFYDGDRLIETRTCKNDSLNYFPEMNFDGFTLTWKLDGANTTYIGKAFSLPYSDSEYRFYAFFETDLLEISPDGSICATSKLKGSTIETLNIPNSIKGIIVTTIKDSGFQGCSNLLSITLPDSISTIGTDAFNGCTKLTEIHAESCTKTKWRELSNLAKVPDQTTIFIKDGGKDGKIIEEGIVYYVDKLSGERYVYGTEGTITAASIKSEIGGDSVTAIGEKAFDRCTNLARVELPDSIKTIGEYAFSSCSSLENIALPNSIESIGCCAFLNCPITSITLPNSLTDLGIDAFRNSNLKSVTIPGSITTLGRGVFSNSDELTDVTIQSGVTTISEDCFSDCSRLKNIYIPETVVSIEKEAFGYCHSLTSIIIPGSVESIEDFAFIFCSNLTDVTISEGVISIGYKVFDACWKLKSITIPSSVTSIADKAFYGCKILDTINIKQSTNFVKGSPWGGDKYDYYTEDTYVHVEKTKRVKVNWNYSE